MITRLPNRMRVHRRFPCSGRAHTIEVYAALLCHLPEQQDAGVRGVHLRSIRRENWRNRASSVAIFAFLAAYRGHQRWPWQVKRKRGCQPLPLRKVCADLRGPSSGVGNGNGRAEASPNLGVGNRGALQRGNLLGGEAL